ncbi:MAG: HEPN domain-containing protein [Syntrophorhabdales bacterium]|jgi:HEPN domain-containing protein
MVQPLCSGSITNKLLKAILSFYAIDFPRTHSLRFLMDLLADAGRRLPDEFSDMDTLTP